MSKLLVVVSRNFSNIIEFLTLNVILGQIDYILYFAEKLSTFSFLYIYCV